MKELSIEEKAKAYDKLFVKAQQIYNKENDVLILHTIEDLFPEFKESEDERIRKKLMKKVQTYIDGDIPCGYDAKKALAWLEKQGEHANFINKIQIGDKVTRNEDGVLVNLSQLKRVAKKDEKQGEQKPVEPMIVGQEPLYDYTNANICQKDFAEQKPAWSEEDAKMLDEMYEFFDTRKVPSLKHATDDYAEFIKSLKGRCLPQPKQEWSKEDERMLKNMSNIISDHYIYESLSAEDGADLQDWLKSLKDRVQPRPEQEWSEEDESMLKSCISAINCANVANGKREMRDWLKSLRPQKKQEWSKDDEILLEGIIGAVSNKKLLNKYQIEWLSNLSPQKQWKPSDKQMNTLEYYMHTLVCNEHKEILFGLYSCLKKLREEDV